MASAPQTFNVLMGIQWRIQNEVKVGGLSPFTAWNHAASISNPGSESDFTRYSTNPNGTITNAIYAGFPKDFTTSYPVQCAIIPNDDKVYWRANPRVYDEMNFYIRCWFYYKDDWYGVMQTALAVRDQLQTVIMQHAELTTVAEVEAAKQMNSAKGLGVGFFFDEMLGNDWLCYATTWWHRQQWNVPSGQIQP